MDLSTKLKIHRCAGGGADGGPLDRAGPRLKDAGCGGRLSRSKRLDALRGADQKRLSLPYTALHLS
jgi:hypothetical protein